MHYFAHTLKGCGSFALALVLTACGEEMTSTSAAASSTNLEAQESRVLGAIEPHTLAQRTVVTEVSSPAVGTNDSSMIAAPIQNTQPVQQGPITRPPANREYEDSLPELPPINYADSGAESSEPAVGAPTEQPTATPQPAEPILGADPLVTLIAKTDSDLNSSGTQLVWSAENVDSCTASGAWTGNLAASGEMDLQHSEPGDHTYMIMCDGPSGTAMAMVTIEVESTELAWEPPVQNTNGTQLTDLAGYNLYYGTESGRYTQVRPVRDASQTDLVLPVEPGTYYLAMTAYDLSGNESDLSNEIVRIVN